MNRFTYKLNRLVYLEAIEPQWNTKDLGRPTKESQWYLRRLRVPDAHLRDPTPRIERATESQSVDTHS